MHLRTADNATSRRYQYCSTGAIGTDTGSTADRYMIEQGSETNICPNQCNRRVIDRPTDEHRPLLSLVAGACHLPDRLLEAMGLFARDSTRS